MKFLIQQNLINPDSLKDIIEAVKDYPHEFIDIIPFSREIISKEPLIGKDFIPYGSTSLIEKAYEEKWTGLSFDLNKANYEMFCKHRDDMLNNTLFRLDNAIKFLKTQKEDLLWFTRPSKDLKEYTGFIDTTKNIIELMFDRMLCASSGSYKLEPDTMIILDQPINIDAEYRWFIVNRKIISGSMYKKNGELYSEEILDRDIIREAQTFASKWLPHDNCVMDLALVGDKLKVIEFNCINSSGFYKCNVNKIFKVLWEYYEN